MCKPHGNDQNRVFRRLVRSAHVRPCQRNIASKALVSEWGCRYALKCIAEQRGEPLPKLFQDDGWRLLHHDVMSVVPLFIQRKYILHPQAYNTAHLAPLTSQVHVELRQPGPAPLRLRQVAQALTTTLCLPLFCIVLLTPPALCRSFNVGTGPVVSDGFGLGYIIKDEGMQICCTSFRRVADRFDVSVAAVDTS
jgi:hypothetical protein